MKRKKEDGRKVPDMEAVKANKNDTILTFLRETRPLSNNSRPSNYTALNVISGEEEFKY